MPVPATHVPPMSGAPDTAKAFEALAAIETLQKQLLYVLPFQFPFFSMDIYIIPPDPTTSVNLSQNLYSNMYI